MLLQLGLLSGCAINMKVPIHDSEPSKAHYVIPATAASVTLFFTDSRPAENKGALLTGRIPMQLTTPDDKPFDAFAWLAAQTVREMAARGLPVQLGSGAPGADAVLVKHIHIENRRVSGFSPFETFTSVSADVVTPAGTQRIVTFIKRGKVPVWSFNEVIEPTYGDPMGLTAKELAAKLARILFDARLSDSQVDLVVAKTNGAKVDYRDVYELGFSNNPHAIPQLVALTSNADDEVHQAAYSSLGILRDSQHYDLLMTEATNAKDDWEDRAVA
ncbi:MAG: HEAT repeat domain-containing protein, partial [Gammaproteobacteria bacterium]|nr:HEAT repeat domain-containing protein [Gammaproteobacteria bacterium]